MSDEERQAYIEYFLKTFRRLPPLENEWRRIQRAKEARIAQRKKAKEKAKETKRKAKARAVIRKKEKKKKEKIMNKMRAEQAVIAKKRKVAKNKEEEADRVQRKLDKQHYIKVHNAARREAFNRRRRRERAALRKLLYSRAQAYKEEIQWLKFCNLSEEERENYLAYKRLRGGRLPKEYTLKWLRPIRRRERAIARKEKEREKARNIRERRHNKERIRRLYLQQKIELQKRKEREKKAQEKLEADYKKYGYFRNEGERRTLVRHYQEQQRKKKLLEERLAHKGIESDEYGRFAIYRFRNQRSKEIIATKKWKTDILDCYESIIEDNKANIKVPDLRKYNHYDLLLTRRVKEGESNVAYLKDKNGKLIPHVLTNAPTMLILRKENWFIEENFYVYGYHPTKERKEFNFVYDELLLKDLGERYEEKKVMTHNSTLYIICDDNFELIRARDNTVAFRLYMTLQEEIEKNKVKGVFFLGEMGETIWEKFKIQLYDKTGWVSKMMEK